MAKIGRSTRARKEAAPDVDELYGLEPVIEPGDGEGAGNGAAGLQWWAVQCPYCGEPFDTAIDFSSGSTSYIEDCPVCCRPIEFRLDIEEGRPARLHLGRSD
jgi:hypothetical protein